MFVPCLIKASSDYTTVHFSLIHSKRNKFLAVSAKSSRFINVLAAFSIAS
jgi:hypothetical protein